MYVYIYIIYILYYIILYYILLYYIVLYYIILYYIICMYIYYVYGRVSTSMSNHLDGAIHQLITGEPSCCDCALYMKSRKVW